MTHVQAALLLGIVIGVGVTGLAILLGEVTHAWRTGVDRS